MIVAAYRSVSLAVPAGQQAVFAVVVFAVPSGRARGSADMICAYDVVDGA